MQTKIPRIKFNFIVQEYCNYLDYLMDCIITENNISNNTFMVLNIWTTEGKMSREMIKPSKNSSWLNSLQLVKVWTKTVARMRQIKTINELQKHW